MTEHAVLLSAHYFPCIEWFRSYLLHREVYIEQHEFFLKQTFRNRTIILSANGPLALTVPVSKLQTKTAVKDMRIDYTDNWPHRHMEALRAAYNSSPYFMYYAHYFEAFYKHSYGNLLELNLASVSLMLKLMKQQHGFQLTENYVKLPHLEDMRDRIHPKKPSQAQFREYLQVFASKYPFVPNMSVLDVFFNCGPDTFQYICS